jgi:hypothetical protein
MRAASRALEQITDELVFVRQISLQNVVVEDLTGWLSSVGKLGHRMALPILIQQSRLNADADLLSLLPDKQRNRDPADANTFLARKTIQFEKAAETSERLCLDLDGCFAGGLTKGVRAFRFHIPKLPPVSVF